MSEPYGYTSSENRNAAEQGASNQAPPPIPEKPMPRRTEHVAPFGGGPVSRPAPPTGRKRNLFPWVTCLIIFLVLAVIGIGALMFIGSAIKSLNLAPIQAQFTGKQNTIGLVRIDGAIYDERKTLEVIKHYREKDIRAILVRINSPGGAVGPSQEIYNALRALREEGRLVVASMSGVAASGGQ